MKPSYSSNFDKSLLLLNIPIKVQLNGEDEPIFINIPSIKTLFTNESFSLFLQLLSDKKLWEGNGFIGHNRMEVICGVIRFMKDDKILKVFNEVFPNLTIDGMEIKFKNTIIDSDLFDSLTDMLLVGCNYLSLDDFQKKKSEAEDQALSDFAKKQKELEEKINKIKGGTNLDKKSKQRKEFSFSEALICVLSYFPQYTIDTLIELNYFTFFVLYEWALKREYQFVQDVAAGNGLMSEKNKYQPLF